MAAAMAVLLGSAGMSWGDLRRICICGAFGRTLNLDHARQIGLLPPATGARVELHAGAALAGCERALLSRDGEALLRDAAAALIVVNMSETREFDDLYMVHLRLRPILA